MKTQTTAIVAALVVSLGMSQELYAQMPAPGMGMGGYYPAMPAAAQAYPGTAYPGVVPAPLFAAPAASASFAGPAAQNGGKSDCGKSCGKGCGDCCWTHRFAAFGELLYLRARDSEVAYGVAIDGPITSPPTAFPIQVGRVGVVDQDYDPGFRAGINYVINCDSALSGTVTMFETGRLDQIATSAPDVISSLVSHPGTSTAAQSFLSANADHRLSYDLADLDYRGVISCCDSQEVIFVVGARYAGLEQQLTANFVATGTETVTTDIDFDGIGLHLGLEGERYSANRRLFVYGKGGASILAGEFRASFIQSQSFDTTVVNTSWQAGRIVPILDLEVGAGWISACGTWRLSAGYLFNAWYNTVKTDDWIQAVRGNNFVDLGDQMTFDGLVARVEGRF